MMRFLTPVLQRLFKPKTPMDLHPQIKTDPVGDALSAAVDEHTRVFEAEASGYERRVRETMEAIDDVINRVGKQYDHG